MVRGLDAHDLLEARLMQTTAKGVPYPENSESVRIWEWSKTQADAINDRLGAYVCTSSTRPSPAWAGQQIYETDSNLLRMWDGTAWQVVTMIGAWKSYTPTVYDGDSTVSTGVSGVDATYTRVGQMVTARGIATLANATANGTGVSLPVQAAARVYAIGSAGLYGASTPSTQAGHAYMNTDLGGVSRLVIVGYTGAFLNNAAGNSLRWQATYQAAAGV
jgi:hypothetical protein